MEIEGRDKLIKVPIDIIVDGTPVFVLIKEYFGYKVRMLLSHMIVFK